MVFKEKLIRVKEVQAGDKVSAVFLGTIDNRKVVSMKTGCGCYSAKLDSTKNIITITFKAPTTPRHLKGQKSFTTVKTVKVLYDDGSSDVLSCEATIKI
jgi:hypothetical protein